jgi:hypothetical protein
VHKIFLVAILFFTGCAYKTPYTSSKPYYIVIKNSQIAVADTGFIKRDESRFNLQLFSASTPIFDLHVDDDVCLDYACLSKKSFNVEFFGVSHYDSFIDELFNFQPIYSKKNLKKSEVGFEQKLKSKSYDITYKIENGNLYFKDTKNSVLIKIKELK